MNLSSHKPARSLDLRKLRSRSATSRPRQLEARPADVTIEADQVVPVEPLPNAHQRYSNARQEHRLARYEEVVSRRKAGTWISAIGRTMNFDRRTVHGLVRADAFPERAPCALEQRPGRRPDQPPQVFEAPDGRSRQARPAAHPRAAAESRPVTSIGDDPTFGRRQHPQLIRNAPAVVFAHQSHGLLLKPPLGVGQGLPG